MLGAFHIAPQELLESIFVFEIALIVFLEIWSMTSYLSSVSVSNECFCSVLVSLN